MLERGLREENHTISVSGSNWPRYRGHIVVLFVHVLAEKTVPKNRNRPVPIPLIASCLLHPGNVMGFDLQ